ncbi:HesA/MoeB/ThiF family protein [Maribacter sp. HTCC2170]|uniref:HesA/MoeB/ThiF family protein n=1 Tax=Maribacter sp. (strain HTCC2170 / KCCM 42371) TaxID=313603 RepID=UPI00006B497C|nr:HesA/MoeB/ThiF family protein [Maribacter sp. HTCC2170]EAR00971.1 rhodanese-like protein [Maribacter sp. HTCC2170]
MNHERYSRQIILKDFGPNAQHKLSESKVLVVGAGGLGVPVLTYLNAMGVGTLGIVDADTVSITNLHRQVLYDENEVGKHKANVAHRKLSAQNSSTKIRTYNEFLNRDNALKIIKGYDVVVDASDNFPTRYLINDACVILNKPFVYGALHAFEGQISVFNFNNGPTYRCLFPKMPNADEIPNCNEHGVLGVIPGIVGNLQALEVIKVLTGVGEVLSGKLLLYSGLNQSIQKIKFTLNLENVKINRLHDNYNLACGVKVDSVEANQFKTLLHSENIQSIDVRTMAEYSQFHLDNTVNLPLDEIEQWKHTISYNRPIYLVCQSGVRSTKGLLILQEHEPNAILINVVGGLNSLKIHANKY